MIDSLRVALLLDPLSMYVEDPLRLRVKWGNHAVHLARELLGRGHIVRGFGAPPGLIPRSSDEMLPDEPPRAGLRTRLLAYRPDVLVAYDALSPAAFRGAFIARRTGAALVLVEAALQMSGRWHERALARVGEFLWGRYVRRATQAVIALDPLAREQAQREGFDGESTTMVPHGVDVSQFRPGLTSTLVARKRIRGRILLYVGRMQKNRGLEVLVSAFARTVGQRDGWSLVFAGDGNARPRLRAMVDRLGISHRVHFLPRPSVDELPGLMGASTLLAVPSRDDEVVGRQIGRALACGLPVLASDRPRLREAIQDGETGLLVESGSVEAWTEAVRRAASSPQARRRWAANARRYAEENLAWEAITSRFETILESAHERAKQQAAEGGRTVRMEERHP